ncbi:response regulator transcription factor [Treponema zuelzerae]|uniref:Response regulator transcription factor n=1 Tax=Teretinema zuelzerae TaxID=156 RepID=A0AAE3EJY3_9SPIR|nr:response regulator transcription factor [Teretinema zuelzerae]MCD1655191.1 response regulator transcription factor [Teretinema zuelzerae]
MKKTVLVADDETKIVDLIANYLKADGFTVISALNGKDALEDIITKKPDCVLLDINMPELDGLSVAKEVRKTSDVPIIFLTARTDEIDRIVGFEIGADDYVSKPFSPRELVARVKAVLRRREGKTESAIKTVVYGAISVDLEKRICSVAGKPIEMTTAQLDILVFMMRSPGRVWNRLELLQASSGATFEGYERTIDAHIKNIRKALDDNSDNPRFIETVRGAGYRFMEKTE